MAANIWGGAPPDFANAMREFQEAARLDSHSPLPAAGLAEAYARAYRAHWGENALKEARLSLARAEALNADSPTVRMASGYLHRTQGDYAKAIEDYQRVKEIEPRNVEALLVSGLTYEAQGQLGEALKDYDSAISADPNNYKPYAYIGALHFRHGQYAEAEKMYRKAIEHAPNQVDDYGSLAGIYIAQAKYADAEEVYKKLLRLKETPLQLNNLGVMLTLQGRHWEALGYYQRAVAMDPNGHIYWLNLGDAQRRIKDGINAKDSYRHGLQLARKATIANVADAPARAYLAYLQARLGFKDEASSQIAAALNSPARDDQVVLCAVKTYEVLGERERALDAVAMATVQTRNVMDHHPDLADLQGDSRFRSLIAQVK